MTHFSGPGQFVNANRVFSKGTVEIDQFRYTKIQLNTIDLSTEVLRSIVLSSNNIFNISHQKHSFWSSEINDNKIHILGGRHHHYEWFNQEGPL